MDKKRPLIKSIKIDDSFMMKIEGRYLKITPVESEHVTNTTADIEEVKFEDAVDFMIDNLNDKIESLESKLKALETVVTTLVDSINNERERNQPYSPENDVDKEIENLYYAGKDVFNK